MAQDHWPLTLPGDVTKLKFDTNVIVIKFTAMQCYELLSTIECNTLYKLTHLPVPPRLGLQARPIPCNCEAFFLKAIAET